MTDKKGESISLLIIIGILMIIPAYMLLEAIENAETRIEACQLCEYDNVTSYKSFNNDNMWLVQCGEDTLLVRHYDIDTNAFGEYKYIKVNNIFCNIEDGIYIGE